MIKWSFRRKRYGYSTATDDDPGDFIETLVEQYSDELDVSKKGIDEKGLSKQFEFDWSEDLNPEEKKTMTKFFCYHTYNSEAAARASITKVRACSVSLKGKETDLKKKDCPNQKNFFFIFFLINRKNFFFFF